MRKIIFILSIMLVMFLVACNSNENLYNDTISDELENLQQEVAGNENMSFETENENIFEENVIKKLLNEKSIKVDELSEENHEYELGKILLDNVEFTVKININVNHFESGDKTFSVYVTILNDEIVLLENEYLTTESIKENTILNGEYDCFLSTLYIYKEKYLIYDRATGGNSNDIRIFNNKGLKLDLTGFYHEFKVVDSKLIYSSYDGETENIFETYRIDYEFVEENGELKLIKIKEDYNDMQNSDDGAL